jgi:hypothetical protein
MLKKALILSLSFIVVAPSLSVQLVACSTVPAAEKVELQCAICQEAIDPKAIIEFEGEQRLALEVLPCGHTFHKPCIQPWLDKGINSCPVCRKPVDPARPVGRAPSAPADEHDGAGFADPGLRRPYQSEWE